MSRLNNFLNNIHKEYVKARAVVINGTTKRIIRGRSRGISGIAEDLFAELILKSIKIKRIRIFVDQPISLEGESQTYYPDIVICTMIEKNVFEILFMIDLKMDVGWHRNSFMQKAKELRQYCKEMKQACKLKGKLGDAEDEKKQRIEFRINKKASYDEVIISSRNSGNPKNEAKMIKASNNEKMNLWVLSTGQHPNWYVKKSKMISREKDWKKLIKKIKSLL